MDIVITIISGLLLLTLLVVVHELGHFWAGKKSGIRINEFAVGFGPKLWKNEKNGTLFSIRALPIGGFCSFLGEDEENPDKDAFNSKPVWKRILTILAGPAANIFFALILAIAVLGIYGDYVPYVAEVVDGSPAQEMGIQEGDIIAGMQGEDIDFFMEYQMVTLSDDADSVEMAVKRDGQKIELDIPTYYDAEAAKQRVGISIGQQRQTFGIFEAIGLSFKWMWLIIVQMFSALGGIFTGGAADVAGPVGTVTLIGQAVRYGFETILRMAALLSINLGIINLLPFPALDGGRLVLLGIEGIRKKALPREKEAYINIAGFIVLMGLMVLLTFNDISRLISGG